MPDSHYLHHKRPLKKKGFTLMETMLAVGVSSVIAVSGINAMVNKQKAVIQRNLVAAQSLDMKNLDLAVRQYLADPAQTSAWTNGSQHTITVANLIANGNLPTGFGSG